MSFNLENHTTELMNNSSKQFLKADLSFVQSIVETIRESLVILDTNLLVRMANHSFYKTFHVSPKETENHFIYDLGNGQWNIPQLQSLLESVLTENTTFENFEVEHEFQHIGRKVMLLNARQIFQADVQTGMILLAIEDITQQKQAIESLQLFATKLEQSNQALQDFASVASHDLQEPLRKIQAFGDLLTRECGQLLPENGQQYLQRMQNAAGRMQILINDLLAFSRVTTKGQPFTTVDLNQVVQEVLSDLEIHLKAVNGQVNVDCLPTIEADPLQMRQLFQNLISNSLKFHQPDVPPIIQIYAQISPASAPKGQCQLFVEDNGIGFDEKYLDRIFTVFQRLHYRNEYEGTGVGLAICRKIAERHRGNITAKSHLNKGSTFVVSLPIHQPVVKTEL